MTTYSEILLILPGYLKQFNAAGTAAGYLVAAFGTAQIIFSHIGGRFSDKYGRRIMILSGLFFTIIADFIIARDNTHASGLERLKLLLHAWMEFAKEFKYQMKFIVLEY